ncbi:unnamed protein product [Boreogadus saida]
MWAREPGEGGSCGNLVIERLALSIRNTARSARRRERSIHDDNVTQPAPLIHCSQMKNQAVSLRGREQPKTAVTCCDGPQVLQRSSIRRSRRTAGEQEENPRRTRGEEQSSIS